LFLRPLLYETSPRDRVVLVGVALLLLVVATLACLPSARRAMRVAINVAIRHEYELRRKADPSSLRCSG
jgi:ABC-type lipoprotein release transport system permease subunit